MSTPALLMEIIAYLILSFTFTTLKTCGHQYITEITRLQLAGRRNYGDYRERIQSIKGEGSSLMPMSQYFLELAQHIAKAKASAASSGSGSFSRFNMSFIIF